MLYNYIMELKNYLIIFLICSIFVLMHFLKKTENFDSNSPTVDIDNLIKLNGDFQPDDLKRDIPIMKNLITNVLDDHPSCNVNPIKNLNVGETDLRIKYMIQYVKLNGLKWALKKIIELEK